MSAETLLSKLEGVRESSLGQFMAICPSHDDQSPSLAIRDCDDGRMLIHCFAGCETEDVLAAVGLRFSDIMSERIDTNHAFKPIKNWVSARDALSTLDHESLVIGLIGADFLKHKSIDQETWSRLAKAVSRINSTRAKVAPARAKS